MSLTRFLPRRTIAPVFAGLISAFLLTAGGAAANSAIVASDGTLYEVFSALGHDIDPTILPGAPEARYPVVALRTTYPGGQESVEIVDGTLESSRKGLASVEFEESTRTVFVCYARYQGVFSDMHVAVRRDGVWAASDIQPSQGLYLSANPRMAVTRQQYRDLDGLGGTVMKTRSILSLVWWEESGPSQARYAPVFVEDGALHLDDVTPYNLNDLVGRGGVTQTVGLPFSSYMFPAVKLDPARNGGVLVSFANLATQREQVISITFLDDLTQAGGSSAVPGGPAPHVRAHIPVGRELQDRPIPVQRDVQSDVDYFLTTSGRATSWWTDGPTVYFLRNDANPGEAPKTLRLRSDFTVDRALTLIREMNER